MNCKAKQIQARFQVFTLRKRGGLESIKHNRIRYAIETAAIFKYTCIERKLKSRILQVLVQTQAITNLKNKFIATVDKCKQM